MTDTAHDTVLQVTDLLDRPGASRRLDLELPVPDDLDLPLVTVLAPVHLAGVLESVVDGLLVRGTLTATIQLACSRCLKDASAEVATEVAELFSDPAAVEAGDEVEPGYAVTDGQLSLDTLLRDTLVPAVPYRTLCQEACKGLCPTCGEDRNTVDCDCSEVSSDARWSALEGLREALPLDGSPEA